MKYAMLVLILSGCSTLVDLDGLRFDVPVVDASSQSDAAVAQPDVVAPGGEDARIVLELLAHQSHTREVPLVRPRSAPPCAGATFHAATHVELGELLEGASTCLPGDARDVREGDNGVGPWSSTSFEMDEETCVFHRVRSAPYVWSAGASVVFEDEGVYVSATESVGTMYYTFNAPPAAGCRVRYAARWLDLE